MVTVNEYISAGIGLCDDIRKDYDYVQFLVVDLFCGAGGTTTGFDEAEFEYRELYAFLRSQGITPPKREPVDLPGARIKVAKVIACINHDFIAIKSHWSNHKGVRHFNEDIRKLDPNGELKALVDFYRRLYPHAKLAVWASLECTNFSKAKGGLARDADSRTLAHHLLKYITALDPDYVMIENVVEFMMWGPMIHKKIKSKEGYESWALSYIKEKKKVVAVVPFMIPESKTKGQDWMAWRESICDLGYHDEWRQMNAADFGALTSRNRLFGCFAKHGLPIVWPNPTHAKNPDKAGLFGTLEKWQPVKTVLDFDDEGQSIFNRQKRIPKVVSTKQGYSCSKLRKYDSTHKTFGPLPDPLSSATMQRLLMSSIKHIAGGKEKFEERVSFLLKSYSGDPRSKNASVDGPHPAITTIPHEHLVSAFITKYNSNNAKTGGNSGHSVDGPAPVVSCQGRLALAKICFLTRFNGVNGGKHHNSKSVEEPIGALGCRDDYAKADVSFISRNYTSITDSSIDNPIGALLPNPKANLVKAYLFNPGWHGASSSIEKPSPVVIARQDKAPIYLITGDAGPVTVPVYEDDCEWTVALKEFMYLYGISDIKMRMLKVIELKLIQGFPKNYVLLGTQSDQKKFIGNAVHPKVPKYWIRALSQRLYQEYKIAA